MPLDIPATIAALTLEEKAALVVGRDFWTTAPVERLGVGSVMVTDGPHGVRKQVADPDHLGLGESVPATCFPPAVTLGSSWDLELTEQVGAALGAETRANDVAVLLGPGVNIKRSPLCGRNFEYVSEDPHLAGRVGAALVNGIQSQGVGTSLKHFAANNQEADRMRVSADLDERTLREIYLPAFEHVVTTAQPWTVMCSYNKINGVYAAQNPWLLNQVLRDEWGFAGLVVSDWGAVSDRVASVAAGLDLEMPGTAGRTAAEVVAAVQEGRLDEADLDRAVANVLHLVDRSPAPGSGPAVDVDAHHALARQAAAAGAVLLKNDPVDGTPLLPLAAATRIGVVGEFARTPRYQGAGSSQVNPTRLDDALTALRAERGDVPFAAGFAVAGVTTGDDAELRAEAVALAADVDVVVLFLGLPGEDESEGFDRTHLRLPAAQLETLAAVAAANPRVVVVLANGGVVELGWRESAAAILETWLGGQAGGSATADLLTGAVAPGGRLAETIPHRLEDTPAFGNFPGESGHVRYGEGVLVGYRWYDTRDTDVAYPFGHGLTYTTFGYGPVTATTTGTGTDAAVEVHVAVTNTGARAGDEVVQVYVRDPQASVVRPTRELRAFAKVHLAPGETQRLAFTLGHRDLAFWHAGLGRFVVEGGEFVVEVGSSSRDLRGSATVEVEGEALWGELTVDSTYAEWTSHPVGGPALRSAIGGDAADLVDPGLAVMLGDMPARVVASLGLGGLDATTLDRLITDLRAADRAA